ncbi:MAG: ADP-ribosylglycohydrolase family protein [Solirubrobacterales bacterium]
MRSPSSRAPLVLLAGGLALLALLAVPAAGSAAPLSDHEVRDKVAGGWVGALVGAAWAYPTEFDYRGRIMPARAVPHWSVRFANRFTFRRSGGPDESYVEIPFMDALRRHGVTAGWPEWGPAFAATNFRLFFANKHSRRNLRRGIAPPLSGDPQFSPNAYDIDFQIESDFIGLAAPAQPGAAIDIAWRMGHVMNYGDGVYGGVMVSAMHAAAFRARSVLAIVEAGRDAVPAGTAYRRMIEDVLRWHRRHPRDWKATWRRLERRWNAHTPQAKRTAIDSEFNIDAKLNGAYILLGLLYGHGDFERTIRVSMRAGQDTDCNPANAASIIGTWKGRSGIPKRYRRGIAYRRDFPFTGYTLARAIRVNLGLARELTVLRGGSTEPEWQVQPSPVVPPAFEQWPLAPDQGPSLVATATPAGNERVDFSAVASDPDGVRDVWWSFGDLEGGRGASVSHAYRRPGSYRVIVWASDELGRTSTQQLSVQAG